jgi:hypothetical protein
MTNRFESNVQTNPVEDQQDFDRWSGEGGIQRASRAAVIEAAGRTHKAPPGLDSAALVTSEHGRVTDQTATNNYSHRKSLGPMRLLCFAGLHAWPRVHGTWREIVVSPSTSACRRCLKPIASFWRSQYPNDGSRCGRECSMHAAPSRKVTV